MTPPDPAANLRRPTGTRFTRIVGVAVAIGVLWLLVFGLVLSPDDAKQKAGVRILYIHVPSAWLAYLAFVVTGIASAAYLFPALEASPGIALPVPAREIGVLFMGVTLITGSLWGRISWGIYWTWDSRLTTTAFLFVTYIGYLAVRGLGGSHQQRARRSAVLALLAVLEVPLVHFSVKWWRPLHQQESVAEGKLNDLMLFSLFVGIVSFTLLYVWLLLHRQRVLAMLDIVDDKGLDRALAERRAEAQEADAMIAVMSAAEQLPYVLISYAVTIAGIGIYAWRVLRAARTAAQQVPPEDRPWT